MFFVLPELVGPPCTTSLVDMLIVFGLVPDGVQGMGCSVFRAWDVRCSGLGVVVYVV